jgi:hypothetical protein
MRSPLVVVLVLVPALALGGSTACESGSRDRPASTVTYSARQARPDRRPPPTRTLDSTGFVDNAGRTSEQTTRTEASGMRATETGSERPTGTAGSGLPLPLDPQGHGEQIGEGAGSLGGDDVTGTGAPGDMLVGRIAQARCDRETACDRIGRGKALETTDQCLSTVRGRSRADVVGARCARGFDTTQIALCLTSIRQYRCASSLDAIDVIAQCQRSALCVP